MPTGADHAVLHGIAANAVGTATLSNGRAVVVTATEDGIVRIWKPEAFTRGCDDKALLCEINVEVPVSDISVIDHESFVIATPNGLTAVRLDARLLENHGTSLEYKHSARPRMPSATSRRS